MIRLHHSLFASGILLFLTACGATVQSASPHPETPLRSEGPLFVALRTAQQTLVVSTTNPPTAITATLTASDQEAIRALESFSFELTAIGFAVVADSTKARTVVELTFAPLRYDPVAGWIARQALARFRRVGTGEIVSMYRANPQIITPTVEKLVTSLAEAIRTNY